MVASPSNTTTNPKETPVKSYLITAAIALAAVAIAMRVEPLKKLVTGA